MGHNASKDGAVNGSLCGHEEAVKAFEYAFKRLRPRPPEGRTAGVAGGRGSVLAS